MGIFGTGKPLIKVVSTATEIDLDYAVIERNSPVFSRDEHKNPISKNKIFVTNGYWWIFEVIINIYKHESDSYTKYSQLANLLHNDVYVKPYSDHGFLQNSGGNVEFYFSEIMPVELNNVTYENRLMCRFESKDLVDISLSAAA